jgi:hypothetical protein
MPATPFAEPTGERFGLRSFRDPELKSAFVLELHSGAQGSRIHLSLSLLANKSVRRYCIQLPPRDAAAEHEHKAGDASGSDHGRDREVRLATNRTISLVAIPECVRVAFLEYRVAVAL